MTLSTFFTPFKISFTVFALGGWKLPAHVSLVDLTRVMHSRPESPLIVAWPPAHTSVVQHLQAMAMAACATLCSATCVLSEMKSFSVQNCVDPAPNSRELRASRRLSLGEPVSSVCKCERGTDSRLTMDSLRARRRTCCSRPPARPLARISLPRPRLLGSATYRYKLQPVIHGQRTISIALDVGHPSNSRIARLRIVGEILIDGDLCRRRCSAYE